MEKPEGDCSKTPKHFFGLKYSPEEFEEIEEKFSFLKKNLKMNNTQLLKYIIKNFNLN